MTWKRHRTHNPRNCDNCPPRHPAIWILNRRPFSDEYLCVVHAEREAAAYGIDPPPRTP